MAAIPKLIHNTMFSIKINGQTVDLPKGISVEFERNNPMFLLENLLGEYSNPLTINYSENNVAIFGALFFELVLKSKQKITCQLYDGNHFFGMATLVIEKATINRLVIGKSKLNGYLIAGISNLLTKLKDKKATTLQLGGMRSYAFTTTTGTDETDGYLQRFQRSRSGNDDFIVAPVRNENWDGKGDESTIEWMNPVDDYGNLITYYVPGEYALFPSVKYVITQIFNEFGFTVDTSLLNATGWQKLFFFSAKAFKVMEINYAGESETRTYFNPFVFYLADTFSPEVTIKDVLLGICKKYGLVPLLLNDTTFQLTTLNSVGSFEKIDWTPYMDSAVLTDFSAGNKVFQFKNTFTGNDSAISEKNTKGWIIIPPVSTKADLPTPLGDYDNSLVFVEKENRYYKIDLNEANERVWVEHFYNMFSDDIDNATDTFETDVATLPVYYTHPIWSADRGGYFPYCKQSRFENWGLKTLVFLGNVNQLNADGSESIYTYPYLSSNSFSPGGDSLINWSNVPHHKVNGADKGIAGYFFNQWTTAISANNATEENIYLPFHEVERIAYNRIYNIRNIPFLLKSYIETRPYKGYIAAKLQMLNLLPIATNVEGGVFVHFVWEDIADADDRYIFGDLIWTNVQKAKPMVKVFADAAATTPLAVANLRIKLSVNIVDGSGAPVYGSATNYFIEVNSSNTNIAQYTVYKEDGSGNQPPTSDQLYDYRWHPVLLPEGAYYYNQHTLRTSDDYVIIP